MSNNLTHFDDQGNAIMVDVSQKQETYRVAVASGVIYVSQPVLQAITTNTVEKGDVLGVARVAGIMAVKQTANLIPMCHPLHISKCAVDFNIDMAAKSITATTTVALTGKTGVEMEALTGTSVALLTIYDMCKAIDKTMTISEICLQSKSGGKSGDFAR